MSRFPAEVPKKTHERCGYCRGTGADPMSDNVNWLPCPDCRGTGMTPIPPHKQREAALNDPHRQALMEDEADDRRHGLL